MNSETSSSTSDPEPPSWLRRLRRWLGGDRDSVPDNRQQLLELLHQAQRKGLVSVDDMLMIEGILHMGEMRVRDIMVPRSHVIYIHKSLGIDDMLEIIASSGHSRFPVVDEKLDDVEGILLAKDLSRYHDADSRGDFELNDILRPAVFIPESKRLNVLLKDFRQSRNHMAIVVDEHGGVAGLVTIEDVLEQIVGEIDDEHDAADVTNIRKHESRGDDGQGARSWYTIRGATPLEEFNQYFGEHFYNDKFETVAGLITHELGRLPKNGEEARLGRYLFRITSANSRRINQMRLQIVDENGTAGASDAGGHESEPPSDTGKAESVDAAASASGQH